MAADSSQVAATLVSAITEILNESVARIHGVDDAEDVLRVLSVMHHAITDSTAGVKRVLQESIGARPAFDEERNQQLQVNLQQTRAEIEKCDGLLLRLQGTTHDGGPLGRDNVTNRFFSALQGRSEVTARKESAERLQALLETDLRNAGVQRVIASLHTTCQSQVKWEAACGTLAAACQAAQKAMKAAYTQVHRQRHTIEEVARQEAVALQQKLQQQIQGLRAQLDTAVATAVAHAASSPSHARVVSKSEQHAGRKTMNNLLARLLLEYSML